MSLFMLGLLSGCAKDELIPPAGEEFQVKHMSSDDEDQDFILKSDSRENEDMESDGITDDEDDEDDNDRNANR